MVLKAGIALCALVTMGCSQSLFDANGKGGDGDGQGGSDGGAGPDGPVAPDECPEPCFASAASDWNGSQGGANGAWRYLADQRDRLWSEMAAGEAHGLTGLIGGGATPPAIASCTDNEGAEACADRPDALLLYPSASGDGNYDPALEVEVDTLGRVRVSGQLDAGGTVSAVHDVWLYRNSREDILLRGQLLGSDPLAFDFEVDILAGDRLLLAVEPRAEADQSGIAVDLFVTTLVDPDPAICNMALTFDDDSGSTVTNTCGANLAHSDYDGDVGEKPIVVRAAPFAELGDAIDIAPDHHIFGEAPIAHSGDFTLQFWAVLDQMDDVYTSILYSDIDLFTGNGFGLDVYDDGSGAFLGLTVITEVVGDEISNEFSQAAYPQDAQWHFVRLVRRKDQGQVSVCVDGQHLMTMAVEAELDLSTGRPPNLGRNQVWSPQVAVMDGGFDDVRYLDRALPCQP